jgi:hypothetical protein
MNPFKVFKERNKEDRKEMDVREIECRAAVEAVLTSYRCELRPRLVYLQQGTLPDVQIIALPKHQDGQPTEQPAEAPQTNQPAQPSEAR